MAKQSPQSQTKANEQKSEVRQEPPVQHATPSEPKNALQGLLSAVKSASSTAAHIVGYAYVPFQSKWFAHGATEVANMILHGHPAPVYDSGSVFGSPVAADKGPDQTSFQLVANAGERNQPPIAHDQKVGLKPEIGEVASNVETKHEMIAPIIPVNAPESSVEQRMQEIQAMTASQSMQQQVSH